jgi:DMSO/TMAO reductase YedYZ molybdopterin-dependent catalytic subunit
MSLVRRLKTVTRAPSGRLTNLQLFMALLITFATGVGAVATGSERGRWVVVAHGVAAAVVVLLIPWKTRVARAGVPLHPYGRWPSLLLAVLTLVALLLGLGYGTGLVRSIAGTEGLWWHVAVALALVPVLLWHLVARRVRPRRTDASRRVLLRTGLLTAVGGGLYAAVNVLPLPGAARRFTGSYELASFNPPAMPNTIWLNDTAPTIRANDWRLTVVDTHGRYDLTLPDLRHDVQTWRSTLDCTSGWYAHQDWTGVPVSRLIRDVGDARSLRVHSTSGYWVRLPIADLDSLLLATDVGGKPLSTGHGFPLRLVAPGRRGYWWVKWVDRIELQTTPWWWQPPFPVT